MQILAKKGFVVISNLREAYGYVSTNDSSLSGIYIRVYEYSATLMINKNNVLIQIPGKL